MSTIHVYVVTERADPRNQCLVRASSRQQAIRLAAQRFTECELATTDTVLKLSQAGALIIDCEQEEPVQEDLLEPTEAAAAAPEPRPAEEVFRS